MCTSGDSEIQFHLQLDILSGLCTARPWSWAPPGWFSSRTGSMFPFCHLVHVTAVLFVTLTLEFGLCHLLIDLPLLLPASIFQKLQDDLDQSPWAAGSFSPAWSCQPLWFASAWGFWVEVFSQNICSMPKLFLSSSVFWKTHLDQA